jgi:hypothetical protein
MVIDSIIAADLPEPNAEDMYTALRSSLAVTSFASRRAETWTSIGAGSKSHRIWAAAEETPRTNFKALSGQSFAASSSASHSASSSPPSSGGSSRAARLMRSAS